MENLSTPDGKGHNLMQSPEAQAAMRNKQSAEKQEREKERWQRGKTPGNKMA